MPRPRPRPALTRAQSDRLIHDPNAGMERLHEIMARLRDPSDGCAWDLEQDFASLAPYAIEEAHEVEDAITRAAWDELPGELGDLLLQPVFQARLAEEAGLFDLQDVIAAICDKMIARHPHVFGPSPQPGKSAAQQIADWEAMKARERPAKDKTLGGIAAGLPALTRALKLQSRAARAGFDWPDTEGVLAKLVEEAGELAQAQKALSKAEIAEEMGDLLFTLVNLARHLELDAEATLRAANAKFTRRFTQLEEWLCEAGKSPQQASLEELDQLWEQAKAQERAAK